MSPQLHAFLGRFAMRLSGALRREEGQTTVEYAIVVSLVVAVAVAAMAVLSSTVDSAVTTLAAKLISELP